MTFDAIVVGAGPAGSAAAALLSGAGVRVLLLDRIDPMTGQGVSLAIRSGALAAETAVAALSRGGPTPQNLAPYERARQRALGSAFLLARALGTLAFSPPVAERALARMAARPELGTRFFDAVGGAAPAAAFHPRLLGGLLGV